ncbi:MAG: PspC domain-containing protein [Burkholderiaceae bacterium]
MSLADEIDRLAAQRDAGRLTDAEFEAAKARLFSQPQVDGPTPDVSAINNLRRSLDDRWIGGVCGGLAKMTGVESWIIRLLFVVGLLFAGFGFIPYVLLWIFIPPER